MNILWEKNNFIFYFSQILKICFFVFIFSYSFSGTYSAPLDPPVAANFQLGQLFQLQELPQLPLGQQTSSKSYLVASGTAQLALSTYSALAHLALGASSFSSVSHWSQLRQLLQLFQLWKPA
jgi:hypothetical protein